jgi:NADP-dependent 3-hydroxy acid dehydrogenase YdfG
VITQRGTKRAVITGATSGIGAAIAARLAEEGFALVMLGGDRQRLARVRASLVGQASAETELVDLTRPDRLAGTVEGLAKRLPSLDAIVHAAGLFVGGSALETDREDFEQMLQVNVHAPMAITRALLPAVERARGTLVFINSSGVLRPQRQTASYMACKHALRALTDSLREEVNPRGVRVTTIYPGRTATRMQRALHRIEGKPYRPESLLQPRDVAELAACAIRLEPGAELVDVLVRPMVAGLSAGASGRRSGSRKRV